MDLIVEDRHWQWRGKTLSRGRSAEEPLAALGGCDQIPGLKGKTGVSQQQLLLALGVFIFTTCGLRTRVKKNGAIEDPVQSVLRGVVFL